MSAENYGWFLIGMLLATIGDIIYPLRSRWHAALVALVWTLAIAGRYALESVVGLVSS